eukprot:637173-Pelagomonas_calceolata.AAC.5
MPSLGVPLSPGFLSTCATRGACDSKKLSSSCISLAVFLGGTHGLMDPGRGVHTLLLLDVLNDELQARSQG